MNLTRNYKGAAMRNVLIILFGIFFAFSTPVIAASNDCEVIEWGGSSFNGTDSALREQTTMVALIKRHFQSMLTDVPSAPFYAMAIYNMMDNGKASWGDLDFTEADVASREREAKVIMTKRHFESMLTDVQGAPFYAMAIHNVIANGTTSWNELGFTEADVKGRLH